MCLAVASATRPIVGDAALGPLLERGNESVRGQLGEPDVSDQASQRRDETRRLDPPTPRCFVEPRSPVLLSDLLRQPSVLLTQLIGVLRAEVLLGEDGSHFEHLASAELGIGGAPLGPLEGLLQ